MTLEVDVKGDVYEGLLEKNAADVKGGAGQYFAPRALIKAIVDVVRPAPGEAVNDPACGTGDFLLAAYDYESHHYELDKTQKLALRHKALSGTELVAGVARLCVGNAGPDELVFQTPSGTPLDAKNLYNRELAPACDRIEKPRISWHSFGRAHATLLGDVSGSPKTAQALLGHSDLETTFNTYTHAIPDSQRTAVERVAGGIVRGFGLSWTQLRIGDAAGRTAKLVEVKLARGQW